MSNYLNSEDQTQQVKGNAFSGMIGDPGTNRTKWQGLPLPDFTASDNPLFNLGAGLLTLAATLPRLGEPADVNLFQERLIEDVHLFRRRGRHSKCHPWMVDKCCYLFCVMLDELILHTGWGRRAGWANNTLLSRLYNQRNGGEVFFLLLERIQRYPGRLIDLLELQYVFLRLGFRGRYRHHSRQLQKITADLYQLICHHRPPCYFTPVMDVPVFKQRGIKTRSFLNPLLLLILLLFVLVAGTGYYCIKQFNDVAAELQDVRRSDSGSYRSLDYPQLDGATRQ